MIDQLSLLENEGAAPDAIPASWLACAKRLPPKPQPPAFKYCHPTSPATNDGVSNLWDGGSI
jgi:hypothetical protein